MQHVYRATKFAHSRYIYLYCFFTLFSIQRFLSNTENYLNTAPRNMIPIMLFSHDFYF